MCPYFQICRIYLLIYVYGSSANVTMLYESSGGAGYGLNNVAMRAVASWQMCDENGPDEAPEDTFVGYVTYETFHSTIIHCSAFGSSGQMNAVRLRNSITFHHVDAHWLRKYGSTLKTKYYTETY
jgi:hypothetical protein